MAASTQPWERLPGETSAAFGAFCAFRNLGSSRNLDLVTEKHYGIKTASKRHQIGRWSAAFNWVARAAAWDDEQNRVGCQEQLEAVKAMHRQHAEAAVALIAKARERLEKLLPENLSPNQVLDFIIEAAKLERAARGEPEAIQEQRVKVQGRVDFFTEVDQYADVLRSLRERRLSGGGVSEVRPAQPLDTPPANDKTN